MVGTENRYDILFAFTEQWYHKWRDLSTRNLNQGGRHDFGTRAGRRLTHYAVLRGATQSRAWRASPASSPERGRPTVPLRGREEEQMAQSPE